MAISERIEKKLFCNNIIILQLTELPGVDRKF